MIDQIVDPKREFIKIRLYRQHCRQTEDGVFIKDLQVLDHPTSQILLVDNSVCSFGQNLANGIPITPFQSD
jgi:CTD small phosphatase-like protein 2